MYICTYERNIYLSVRRIYGFTNGFLLIALANCESNEPYVNRIFSSTLTSFLSYLLLNNIFFSWSHGSSDVNRHTFCVFWPCPFSIFFGGAQGAGIFTKASRHFSISKILLRLALTINWAELEINFRNVMFSTGQLITYDFVNPPFKTKHLKCLVRGYIWTRVTWKIAI